MTLIVGNFINSYVKELSPKEFHGIFLNKRQKHHFKIKVAKSLGLPNCFADAMAKLSAIRNSFAHELDHVVTEDELQEFEQAVSTINLKELYKFSILRSDSVKFFVKNDVKINGSDSYIANKNIVRLVNATYMLIKKPLLFSVEEFFSRGQLSLG